jgi:hypothetical protein
MGSRAGLLFLFVNPGWNQEQNRKEDAHCRLSKDDYVDLYFKWFTKSPKVIGKRDNYTSSMISFVGVLRDGLDRFGLGSLRTAAAERKWRRAQESRLIGHWELFPFHSAKDGLTRHVTKTPWLFDCVKASILAALRFQPELLIVMSIHGWEILTMQVLPNQHWTETKLGNPPTSLSYCTILGTQRTTEIVAIRRQVFATYRICTNQELFDTVTRLRDAYPEPT